MAFAEHNFRLDVRRPDGSTERDHLEAAQRQIDNIPNWKGNREAVPPSPPFPTQLAYLWRWFVELSMGIASNGMGPAVVTWEALDAWSRSFLRIDLSYWEALTLIRLGNARAVIESEAAAKQTR